MSPTNIAKLRSVPAPIRDWFDSFELVDIIIDLESKFGLPSDETAIPRLLFGIEVRDFPLDQLERKLMSELSISPLVARELFEEIKVRALLPIASELNTWGVSGLTVSAAPAPVAPTPPTGLPNSFSAPLTSFSIPTSATTQPAAPTAIPTPVSIYKDAIASQSPISPSKTGFMGGTTGSGDISNTVNLAPAQNRAARIDLGVRAPDRMDDALKSLYVERETPKVQAIDYGTIHTPDAAPAVTPTTPVPLVANPTTFTATELPMAPIFMPEPEVVSVPTATPAQNSQGFMDSIMRRIAPWHYAKFGARKDRPAEALAEAIPSATINYSEPTPLPPAPTTAPLPASELPAPPTPLA